MVRGIEDFLFWIFAGVVTFMLLYEQNDGGLRLYAIVGVLVGMSLYDRIVSRFLFAVLKKAGKWFKNKNFNKWVHKSSVSFHYIHFVNHSL